MSNRVAHTDRVELVETHNLLLALNRLVQPPHDERRWKRAFVHALGMSDISLSWEEQKAIREALKLP